jgi:two-component system, cell cycle sensor histidine kinase and response regulator CckA
MSCALQHAIVDQNASSELLTKTPQGILVVEDEPLVREVTGEVLRGAGYTVWTARDAQEAIGLFQWRRAEIRLLITDVTLPDLSGPSLAGKLWAMGGEFQTILTSGYPEPTTTERENLPACVYLAKPFSADLLIRKVRETLQSAGSRSQGV